MQSQDHERYADEESGGETQNQKPIGQWKEVFTRARHDLTPSYLPNVVVTLLAILITPAIGAIMNSPKVIVISAVIGLTLAIWLLGFFVYKRIPQTTKEGDRIATQPTPEGSSLSEKKVSQPTPIEKQTETSPTPQPTKQVKPSISEQPKQVAVEAKTAQIETPIPTPTPTPEPKKMHTLSDEQKIAMVRLLRPHSGQSVLIIKTGDEGALLYAQQIQDVFKASGWSVGIGEIGFMQPAPYGILCGVADPQHLTPAADAVISAFQKAGIRISVDRFSRLPMPVSMRMRYEAQGTIGLRIGSSP